jgi:hypothetical protein
MTFSRELSRYKTDLMSVQGVRWEDSGTAPAKECTFFYAKGNGNRELGSVFFFWYIREPYQLSAEGFCLLVIGCHT